MLTFLGKNLQGTVVDDVVAETVGAFGAKNRELIKDFMKLQNNSYCSCNSPN